MGIEGHRDRGIEKRERNRYEKEGEKVEHSRGSNVYVSGKVDKKRTETGNRSKAKEIKKKKNTARTSASQAVSLSPGLITVRWLRLFIIRPRQNTRLLLDKTKHQ